RLAVVDNVVLYTVLIGIDSDLVSSVTHRREFAMQTDTEVNRRIDRRGEGLIGRDTDHGDVIPTVILRVCITRTRYVVHRCINRVDGSQFEDGYPRVGIGVIATATRV